jgi:hypothetical protein
VDGKTAAPERLHAGEIAERLRTPRKTVNRLFEDGFLRPVSDRGWRMAYADQIDHIVGALAARRTGSIGQFAQEWLDAHPLPAPAEAVA